MTGVDTTPTAAMASGSSGVIEPSADYLDKLTPSVGPGPFYGHSLIYPGAGHAVEPDSPGAVRLRVRVLDGSDRPVAAPDVLIEFLQEGQFARAMADDEGDAEVVLAKPAAVTGAPFFHVRFFVFPVSEPFETRLYFPDETDANGSDEVLSALHPLDRRTLIAEVDDDGQLRWDIRLSGESQTAFFVAAGEASMADTGAVQVRAPYVPHSNAAGDASTAHESPAAATAKAPVVEQDRHCPNGHPLSINVILPPGAGRDYCSTCGWTDAEDTRAAGEMVGLERTTKAVGGPSGTESSR
ncbi:hypothetical protein ACFQH9_11975 [Pseudonocardia lutea]|uniref:Uncharacterized protein n=1 Tax=Pseudonocardia lutea TaxID=2172015 RepID=A0ABW1I9F5_9PSEU